jgi:hypothetical protein
MDSDPVPDSYYLLRLKEISEKVQHFINYYYTDDSNRAGGYYFYAGKAHNR